MPDTWPSAVLPATQLCSSPLDPIRWPPSLLSWGRVFTAGGFIQPYTRAAPMSWARRREWPWRHGPMEGASRLPGETFLVKLFSVSVKTNMTDNRSATTIASFSSQNLGIIFVVHAPKLHINSCSHHFLHLAWQAVITSKGRKKRFRTYLFGTEFFTVRRHKSLEFVRFKIAFLINIQSLKCTKYFVLRISLMPYFIV